jgi:hypothetical protein
MPAPTEASTSANIASNVGAILLGIPVAFVVSLPFRWVWPAMTMPIFFLVLVCWFIVAAALIIRDRPKRQLFQAPWSTADIILATASGVIPASLLGGLIGLYRAWLRWPIFLSALALWIAVGISVVVQDRAAARRRQN